MWSPYNSLWNVTVPHLDLNSLNTVHKDEYLYVCSIFVLFADG